ncbi:hypothetical protein ACROYT_G026346 [Oculina patagonica]
MSNSHPEATDSPSSRPPASSTDTPAFSVFKMTKGCVMLKVKRHGTPQIKRFILSRDLSHVQWGSPRKAGEKSVLVSQMTELIKGQKTKVFQNYPVPQRESMSFSVVYKIGRSLQTMDVVCFDIKQFEVWTSGLQALMSGFNDKKAVDDLYTSGKYQDEPDGQVPQGPEEVPLHLLGPDGKQIDEDACDCYTWGDGTTGMLGHGENGEENVPKVVEALLSKDIVKVACGVTHTIAVSKEGEVFSWGSGYGGKLGQGHLRDRATPLRVAALKDTKVTKIACHEFHSAAVCASGELYTWGKGGPRLGYDSASRKEVLPRFVEGLEQHRVAHVACGRSHTLVCTKNGQCFAFGDNEFGQLGVKEPSMSYEPVHSPELESYHITFVACGTHHSAAISDSGHGLLWMWGDNSSGQLGVENISFSHSPIQISADLRNHHIVDVSCGDKHTVFLSKKGKLFGMGDNTDNQLAINQRGKSGDPVLRVNTPTRIHLSAHSRAAKPVQVSCGASHTAAVTETGEVFIWGKGRAGRLGHGDTRDRPLPCELDMDGKRVRSVACGSTHTACLVTRAWVSDDLIKNCMACKTRFSLVNRKHHCRKCGGVFCASCTSKRTPILNLPGYRIPRRVCDKCYSVLLDET